MQCSECPYNTLYPNSPGAIQDPEYSIQVGIRYYADCVQEAGCTGPEDLERLKLSLQGYNYGNGYISWALQNYGGYSEANALYFHNSRLLPTAGHLMVIQNMFPMCFGIIQGAILLQHCLIDIRIVLLQHCLVMIRWYL